MIRDALEKISEDMKELGTGDWESLEDLKKAFENLNELGADDETLLNIYEQAREMKDSMQLFTSRK